MCIHIACELCVCMHPLLSLRKWINGVLLAEHSLEFFRGSYQHQFRGINNDDNFSFLWWANLEILLYIC